MSRLWLLLVGLVLLSRGASAESVCPSRSAGTTTTPGVGTSDPTSVLTYGAVCDGVTNDTGAIQNALASGLGKVRLPEATCLICDLHLAGVMVEGTGDRSILKGTPGCVNVITTPAGVLAQHPVFRNLKFVGNTGMTAFFNFDGSLVTELVVEDNSVDLTNGGYFMLAGGANSVTLRRNYIHGGCDFTTHPASHVFQAARGGNHIRITDNAWDCVYDGVVLDDELGNGRDVRIERNHGDMLWWLQKTLATNAGNTSGTTYTATVLTDSLAAFPALKFQTVVRVLQPKATGTVTTSRGSEFVDRAARFPASGVQEGDLIRTATAFATVQWDPHDSPATCTGSTTPATCCTGLRTGTCEQGLWVDGWRDSTTYLRTAAPPMGTAYTIYRVLLGTVTSNTAKTITCETTFTGFHDWHGKAVTPGPGDIYEVSTAHPNYQTLSEGGFRHLVIDGNYFRRGWSDQIGLAGSYRARVTNNTVEDGEDGGITIGQAAAGSGLKSGAIVTGNTVRHQGTSGIFLSDGNDVSDNSLIDNRWVNSVAGTALGDCVGWIGPNNYIHHNLCKRDDANLVLATTGMHFRSGASSGNVVEGNIFGGHATAEVILAPGAVNNVFRNNQGMTVVDTGSSGTVWDQAPGLAASLQQWAWQVHDTLGTVDSTGIEMPVVNTPGAGAAALNDATGQYVTYTTTAVSGSFAGWEPNGGKYSATQFQARPAYMATMKTGASVTKVRYWLGLFSGDPSASSTPALHYIAFRYDDALDGATWAICTDNGSGTPNCRATTMAVAITSRVSFYINAGTWDDGAVQVPTFYATPQPGAAGRPVRLLVNLGTLSAKLPTASQNLHAVAIVATRTTATKTISLGRVAVTLPN